MSSSGHPKTLLGKTDAYRRNCTGLGTDHLGLKACQCLLLGLGPHWASDPQSTKRKQWIYLKGYCIHALK